MTARSTAMIRDQPMDGSYFPPAYPHHEYRGLGMIVPIRAGGDLVGHLTRQDDRIGWHSARIPAGSAADAVRRAVADTLREGAAGHRPLHEVWHELLAAVPHDAAYVGELADVLTAGR
jgi:hypothetical protein